MAWLEIAALFHHQNTYTASLGEWIGGTQLFANDAASATRDAKGKFVIIVQVTADKETGEHFNLSNPVGIIGVVKGQGS